MIWPNTLGPNSIEKISEQKTDRKSVRDAAAATAVQRGCRADSQPDFQLVFLSYWIGALISCIAWQGVSELVLFDGAMVM